jgi:hypothetical protein
MFSGVLDQGSESKDGLRSQPDVHTIAQQAMVAGVKTERRDLTFLGTYVKRLKDIPRRP